MYRARQGRGGGEVKYSTTYGIALSLGLLVHLHRRGAVVDRPAAPRLGRVVPPQHLVHLGDRVPVLGCRAHLHRPRP
jgi:hypothetical protein